MRFRDRRDAGERLAVHLAKAGLVHGLDLVVLALPRGGVPVGTAVARRFGTPLEVFLARKVGAPSQPEYGIGAVAEGGTQVVDADALRRLGLTDADFDALARAEQAELARRVEQYRGARALPAMAGRRVVLVDDGLATGVTAEAALRALRHHQPARLILAVPVCAPESADRLARVAEVFCPYRPGGFQSVGHWYLDFTQTTDDEVVRGLATARAAADAT